MENRLFYRLKFEKKDRMRFIGHLDLLKLFQRAVCRVRLPIAYSSGFNPHQIMSFALPLSLGVGSAGEYVDIELTSKTDEKDIIRILNGTMPEGIRVLSVRLLGQDEKNAAASVEAGIYYLTFDETFSKELLTSVIEDILSSKEIFVVKTSKGKQKEIDIRPDIFSLELSDDGALTALISAGSGRNLKADILAELIYDKCGKQYGPGLVKIFRKDLLKKSGGKFIEL